MGNMQLKCFSRFMTRAQLKFQLKNLLPCWKKEGCRMTLKTPKASLTLAVELNQPDLAAPLSLALDASTKSVGSVLQQCVVNQWRPLLSTNL